MLRIRSSFSIVSKTTSSRSNSRLFCVSSNSLEKISYFPPLGLEQGIVEALKNQNITVPTPVQNSVIPKLLNRESIVMAASTGSGKTLSYVLPIIQLLHEEEKKGYIRKIQRPRCLILVPTRELARQVLQAIKLIGHHSKVSSAAVIGGEQYSIQKKALDKIVDIVVASPGRLLQHKEQGNVFLSQVNHIIIDEVDTMLTQGFGSDIRDILKVSTGKFTPDYQGEKFQLVMASATLTKAVKRLLEDVEENGFDLNYSVDPNESKQKKISKQEPGLRVKMEIVEVDGLHRSLPNVKHIFEDIKGGEDKFNLLKRVLQRNQGKMKRTMIFCNTVSSCRATEYFLNEDNFIHSVSYHGDLNSKQREENLGLFRSGEESVLVCTDIAARGIDIPEIDHVIIFDFPMNPIDYLHRAGRCGRAGRKGTVTSLIAKRDKVLAHAIQGAIDKELPLDSLSASKRDYTSEGKLSHLFRKKEREPRNRQSSKSDNFQPSNEHSSFFKKLIKRSPSSISKTKPFEKMNSRTSKEKSNAKNDKKDKFASTETRPKSSMKIISRAKDRTERSRDIKKPKVYESFDKKNSPESYKRTSSNNNRDKKEFSRFKKPQKKFDFEDSDDFEMKPPSSRHSGSRSSSHSRNSRSDSFSSRSRTSRSPARESNNDEESPRSYSFSPRSRTSSPQARESNNDEENSPPIKKSARKSRFRV